MPTAIWWIRRDLRLANNAALASAASVGEVVPVFVHDPAFHMAGAPRTRWMWDTLGDLDNRMDRALVIRHGSPAEQLLHVAREVGAQSVHIAKDFAPYGRRRDSEVAEALKSIGVPLVASDAPYTVEPGRIFKDDGTPLKVFTPFYKRWQTVQWSSPQEVNPMWRVATHLCDGYPDVPTCEMALPPIGEDAAWQRWSQWSTEHLDTYRDDRNSPGIDGTSMLSPYLRFGVVHPRQLLADLSASPGADHFRSELCWREFYADVLFHQPHTMWENLQSKMNVLPVDTDPKARQRFEMFCSARTGYPIVDAGVRQMLQTGWMHNRVRMIVASFLVKDLHLPWQWGARFFMRHLVDGDIASNNHGWQWTAGTGTDAAPYFRVFNPHGQSEKFDPTGDYLRTWIPEIADLDDEHIHAPWTLGMLAPAGYPEPMVDHAVEREEALARYKAVSGK